MNITGIYKIESKIKPEKIYIGSAVSISKRWNIHLCLLRSNKHYNKKLQSHFNKYGESDLQFSVLLGCPKEDLIKIEQFFIDSHNPWFNNRPKAESNLGKRGQIPWNKGLKNGYSDEVRKKMSDSHKGQVAWNKGLKCKKQSDETKLKRSESMKGKNTWRKGMKDTPESRLKKSEAQKTRRRISESMKKTIALKKLNLVNLN